MKSDVSQAVIELINDERARQDRKWGEQHHHPLYWNAIIGEERGEFEKHLIADTVNSIQAKIELVHMIASAIACLEDEIGWREYEQLECVKGERYVKNA